MILGNKTNEVILIGEDTSKRAKISENKMAKLQYLLTKGLYKDPVGSVITEWTNNGIDSVVQSGKDPVLNPVVVTLSSKDNNFSLCVADEGEGLDKDQFENVCMNYLESTKEDNNDTIGHFGIGLKSFLALDRPATFECVKDGVMRKYLVYEGEEFVNYDLLEETETSSPNGVKCHLSILNITEFNDFCQKAKRKLTYYDTAVLVINGRIHENKVHRHPVFQVAETPPFGTVHICLKDVLYEIDWTSLGISSLSAPIALRFELGDGLIPTPSRESYISNPQTKALILEKVRQLANHMVEVHNKTVPDMYLSARPALREMFQREALVFEPIDSVRIPMAQFLQYSTVPLKPIKLPYLKQVDLSLPSSTFLSCVRNYFLANGMFQRKKKFHLYGKHNEKNYDVGHKILFSEEKVVIVPKSFRGYVARYLEDKYENSMCSFVQPTGADIKDYVPMSAWHQGFRAYSQIFNIRTLTPFAQQTIDDFKALEQDVLRNNVIDETNVENDPAFLKYVEDKRLENRENARLARLNGTFSPNNLHKKSSDITLGLVVKKKYYDEGTIDKIATPISSLSTIGKLCVYATDEDEPFFKDVGYMAKRVNFYVIGKLEVKKLPKLKNFITMKQFTEEGTRAFKQLATALAITDFLSVYEKITKAAPKQVSPFVDKLKDDVEVLTSYKQKYEAEWGMSKTTRDAIIAIARDNDFWDKSIYHVLERCNKEISTFEFLSLLNNSIKSSDVLANHRYAKVVHQFLLFNKLYHNKFEDYELVKKKTVEEATPTDEGEEVEETVEDMVEDDAILV